ncbi:MAG: mannose-1-phosphate guanylyltransferase/mannose-6-phosphate isomerase [Gammaproteobacteria bacterium]|nr:mannose-1-phosphate guanylyltransferase/mannose-6-phosphate isomerase [Gammaproteobacteria bacterium]
MTLLPCLLAGGSGTRLWPLSREQYPKQFLRLTGSNTLLQETALRAAALPQSVSPLALCGEQHRFIVAEQLREAGIDGATILLEPEARNTAPAAACAAHWAAERHGPDAVLLLAAADHLIADHNAFAAAVAIAVRAAAAGHIVSFGIRPTRPETGFGYVRAGVPLPSVPAARAIAEFVEKPTPGRARAFVASGDYYWNGGLFLFRADVFLAELRRLEPAMEAACGRSVARAVRDIDFVRLDSAAFAAARSDSLDYAVMEKTDRAALVELDAGWDDVGSWSFLEKQPGGDARGNFVRGDVLLEDCDGSLVHADSRLVALVGVRDQVVVETDDAVLVAAKDRAQDVRKLVARLRSQQRPEALKHRRVYRPWGWYETIASGTRFQVKRIQVKPRQSLSLQMHHHRAEHWVVVTGTARVTCGDREFLLTEDQSTYIPLGHRHRLSNPGKLPLELIEVQSGAYLDEDDIVRFDDVYGRAVPVPARR